MDLNHWDKFNVMKWMTVGYAAAWIIVGSIITIYVNVQTVDATMKRTYSTMAFFLTGLSTFLMWLLWFTMFAAQLNPQIHPEAINQCDASLMCPGNG